VDPSKLIKVTSPLAQVASKGAIAANSEHAVTPLITQPTRDFHRTLMSSVRQRMDEMATNVQEREWKYQIGDRILTPSGQVLEIQGQTWSGGKNAGPRYRTERVDVPVGADGRYKADAYADILEGDQYQLMSGPRKKRGGLIQIKECSCGST